MAYDESSQAKPNQAEKGINFLGMSIHNAQCIGNIIMVNLFVIIDVRWKWSELDPTSYFHRIHSNHITSSHLNFSTSAHPPLYISNVVQLFLHGVRRPCQGLQEVD